MQTATDHSTTQVVCHKVLPRDFPILSLVESQETDHRHSGQHHEKQPIVWIIWITNWPRPATLPTNSFITNLFTAIFISESRTLTLYKTFQVHQTETQSTKWLARSINWITDAWLLIIFLLKSAYNFLKTWNESVNPNHEEQEEEKRFCADS